MTGAAPPFASAEVAASYAEFPEPQRDTLLRLRALIFETARENPVGGGLEESLKWGQPAYRPAHPRTGTTIRLGLSKSGGCALFVHCQTTLIADFRAVAPDGFRFEGNRAMLLPERGAAEPGPLCLLIRRALTYHMPA